MCCRLGLVLGSTNGVQHFFAALEEQGEDGVEHISQSACINTGEAPDADSCHDEYRIFTLGKAITEARQGFLCTMGEEHKPYLVTRVNEKTRRQNGKEAWRPNSS